MTTEPTATLLCTGDIHLGRHPGRIGPEDDELSPAAVWTRIVDEAIDRQVDALVLTGDVVDRDNRYFEARGPLEEGLRRLGEAGVETVAISGNHDFDVLPDLIGDIDRNSVRLLGEKGRWEHHTIDQNGRPAVRFAGWSYPRRHVHHSPLDDLDVSSGDVPTVGLLHTEIDRPDTDYAPAESTRLATCGVDTWLLGHIHRPHRVRSASCPILYPGSPQPLSPTEPGLHGPWLIELAPSGEISFDQLALATLQYRRVDIDITGVETRQTFRRQVTDRVREVLEKTARDHNGVRRLVLRLHYSGRTPLHRRVDELNRQVVGDLELSFGPVEATVDDIRRETRPPVDLQQLTEGNDPPAVLAKLLLEVQHGSEDELAQTHPRLLEVIRDRIDDIYRSGAYQPLATDPETADRPDDEWIRDRIVSEGMALLDTMLDDGPSG